MWLHYCSLNFLLLLLVLHKVDSQFDQLFEGDTCKVTKEGVKHTCKKITDCQAAFDIIRNDERPEICSYNGFTAIVCCKPDQSSSSSQPPTTPERLPPTKDKPNKPLNGFRTISEKKCDEYKKYVYQKPTVETLAISFEEDYEDAAKPGGKKESTCGSLQVPLIVLGEPVAPREFPHQVNIGYRYGRHTKWLCTGSLISENFVLSAAHCSKTSFGKPRVAVVGDLDVESTTDDAKPEQINIIQVIDHPLYNSDRPYNDIALYKLERNVTFDGYKRPACLNTHRHIKEKQAIATGWGNTKAGGSASSHLLKVRLNLIPKETCSQYWFVGGSLKRGIDEEQMICAGDLNGQKDTCQGDSGGPLQNQLTDPFCMYSIIGVTSFGKSCGIKVPGVYTRVSYYVPWIESVVWPNE